MLQKAFLQYCCYYFKSRIIDCCPGKNSKLEKSCPHTSTHIKSSSLSLSHPPSLSLPPLNASNKQLLSRVLSSLFTNEDFRRNVTVMFSFTFAFYVHFIPRRFRIFVDRMIQSLICRVWWPGIYGPFRVIDNQSPWTPVCNWCCFSYW